MNARETELLEVVHHLLRALAGENIKHNMSWAGYHARRAMQGMPTEVAELLDNAFENALVATRKEKTP